MGSNDGHVRILSQAFKVVRTFKAHDTGSITHMKQVDGTALLVTISEDLSNEPILKVWALDKTEKKTGAPKCLSTLGIHNGRKQFPVSEEKMLSQAFFPTNRLRSLRLQPSRISLSSLLGLGTERSLSYGGT